MPKLTWNQHLDISERILRWYVVNGEWPNYATFKKDNKDFKFTKSDWEDSLKRVQSFISKENKKPDTVNYGSGDVPLPSNPSPVSPSNTSMFEMCKNNTLSYGNQNQCVVYAQQKLQEWGYYPYKVDGVYLTETEKSVKAFQTATGHTPDGVLGPKTWSSFPGYTVDKPGVLQGDLWVLSQLESKGEVGTEQGLHNLLVKLGTYLYYYDQQQTQTKTVTTVSGNCADLVNDLGLPYYRSKNIPCRGVHCQVKCSNGDWYGHYLIEIGPQGSKQYRDPAGWCKGKPLTGLICGTGTEGKDFKFLHYEGNYIP